MVLVDGDLQFGDVSVMLGLPPQNTVLDAAAAAQYGDMELVQTLPARHDASGLLVLPAPVEPMPTDAMLPGEMVNICVALQAVAGHVIVDLPSLFNDYVLALLEAADEVLLVGSMDIPSIKNLKIGIQSLDLNAIAGSKLRLVLNHANTKVKLDVKEIERVLGLTAAVRGARRHRGADLGELRHVGVPRRPEGPGLPCARAHRRHAPGARRAAEQGQTTQVIGRCGTCTRAEDPTT